MPPPKFGRFYGQILAVKRAETLSRGPAKIAVFGNFRRGPVYLKTIPPKMKKAKFGQDSRPKNRLKRVKSSIQNK